MDIVDRETGEVMQQEDVDFAYTREGRRLIGKEYPNPIPLEPPIGFVPSVPLHEQIREMVMKEMASRAGENEDETFEEADDFDVGEDYDPSTPYEEQFEPIDPWPATSAVRALEAEIAEHRSRDRLAALQADVAAIREGKPPPSEQTPLEPPPEPAGKKKRGGGGAEPPGGQPTPEAS